MMTNEIILSIDHPAGIASKLMKNEIDVGLVPVAAIAAMDEYHIISDYCIAADGPVASVCLFSDVPLQEIETILLDYQSRTSVALLKILLKEHWKISPLLKDGTAGYEHDIKAKTAGLVIGDRALIQRNHSKYIYDLGQAWKELTGLPFVFAAWVSNKILDQGFINAFNEANAEGLKNIKEVVKLNPFDAFSLEDYYSRFIVYNLSGTQQLGLQAFLTKMNQ